MDDATVDGGDRGTPSADEARQRRAASAWQLGVVMGVAGLPFEVGRVHAAKVVLELPWLRGCPPSLFGADRARGCLATLARASLTTKYAVVSTSSGSRGTAAISEQHGQRCPPGKLLDRWDEPLLG